MKKVLKDIITDDPLRNSDCVVAQGHVKFILCQNVSVWWVKTSFNCTEAVFTTMYHWQFGERKHLDERVSTMHQHIRVESVLVTLTFTSVLEWNKIKMHLCNFNPKLFCNLVVEHSHVVGNVPRFFDCKCNRSLSFYFLPSFHWLEYCSDQKKKKNADVISLAR